MNSETPEKILECLYQQATAEIESDLPDDVAIWLQAILRNVDTDKSLVAVLVTSCLKKLISPRQDIRLHMKKWEGGYSARGLDTNVTTPFFNTHFQAYANKETAFLTKATRADIVWDMDAGASLPLKSRSLINPFLHLIDAINSNSIADSVILAIFAHMFRLMKQSRQVYLDATAIADIDGVININAVLHMLQQHFDGKRSSRLPVIAVHAIYQQMIPTIARYDGKALRPLNVHTSADTHGYGDVEVVGADGAPFEIVEIKHNIPIDSQLIQEVINKIASAGINKYYVLTTYPNSFANIQDEQEVNQMMLAVKKNFGTEIIPNGIIESIKYYLRFVGDYNEYIKSYTNELIRDASTSSEITDEHVKRWTHILSEFGHYEK